MSVAAENYPFCTIDPTTARVAVPDERYEYLCDMWNPPSKYPAFLSVTDIAGSKTQQASYHDLANREDECLNLMTL